MTMKSAWKACATTARPSTATASQTRSPRIRPAAKGTARAGPVAITRATSAATPGPGEAAATSKVAANSNRAADSISTTPRHAMIGTGTRGLAQRELEPRALAMVGVRHRDRQRIGGIVALRVGLRQQHADHHPNLCLLAVAGADNGLLHQIRRIFRNPQPGNRRHQHGDAARLTELEGSGSILIDEGRLDRGLVGH